MCEKLVPPQYRRSAKLGSAKWPQFGVPELTGRRGRRPWYEREEGPSDIVGGSGRLLARAVPLALTEK